jgi:hypothetical protein
MNICIKLEQASTTISSVALLLLTACGTPVSSSTTPTTKTTCHDHTATAVHLPNGEIGGVICCSSKTDCYQQSYRVCNTYYVQQANDVKAEDFTSHDDAVEYVIQCYINPPPKVNP